MTASLEFEGGKQMIHVRNLFESRPFIEPLRIPDQSILADTGPDVDGHVQAARAANKSYWMVYVTNGRVFHLDSSYLDTGPYVAWWYCPRSGSCFDRDSATIREPFRLNGYESAGRFDPPGEPGEGRDWILVLDQEKAGYGRPGVPR